MKDVHIETITLKDKVDKLNLESSEKIIDYLSLAEQEDNRYMPRPHEVSQEKEC